MHVLPGGVGEGAGNEGVGGGGEGDVGVGGDAGGVEMVTIHGLTYESTVIVPG